MSKPRGIRNNNPGNIRWGDPWKGLVPKSERTDDEFCQFVSPVWGIRAICKILQTYASSYGITTVRGIVSRWAPPSENNTKAYVDSVCRQTGLRPHTIIHPKKYKEVLPLVRAIIRHENGEQPYTADTLRHGLEAAGVKPGEVERKGAVATSSLGAAGSAAVVAAVFGTGDGNEANHRADGNGGGASTPAPAASSPAPTLETATIEASAPAQDYTVSYVFSGIAVVLFVVAIYIYFRSK